MLKKLFVQSIPLGFGAIILSLSNNAPRYLIENLMDEYALGIFSALAYPMLAGVAVIHALGQSVMPRLSQYYEKRELVLFKNLLGKICIFGFTIGIPGILCSLFFGERLLNLLYCAEYGQHEKAFIYLMIAALISYVAFFLSYGLLSAKKLKSQLIANSFSFIVSLIGCFYLIGERGISGAAISVVLTFSSLLISNTVLLIPCLKKTKSIRLFKKTIIYG
jgi:O-antigen/teichoic acid export membrane protein